jgi:hypothetical protein
MRLISFFVVYGPLLVISVHAGFAGIKQTVSTPLPSVKVPQRFDLFAVIAGLDVRGIH